MNRFWLKLIGTSGQPCAENYEQTSVTSRLSMSGIHSGDHMILYAVGSGGRVLALARVMSEAYSSGDPDWPNQVDIEYLVRLPVSHGVSIHDINTPEQDLAGPIQWGRSDIELRPEVYEQAAALLQAAASSA
jgi:hypothetical protein